MNKPTVFMADDDLALINALSTRCKARGLRVQTATDASSAWQRIDRCRPDLVILDIDMPCGNGLSVAEMIRSHEALCKTPVIMLTGRKDPETVRRCYDNVAYYVPKGGEVWSKIEPLLEELLPLGEEAPLALPVGTPAELETAASPELAAVSFVDAVFSALGADSEALSVEKPAEAEQAPWVLSVDDDKAFAEGLMLRLKIEGVGFRRAFNGKEGCQAAFSHPAHVILLDYEMPQGNGDKVLRRLKANPATRSIPVIVLTGHSDKSIEQEMLDLGATAFFTKPYSWPELWAVLRPHLPLGNSNKLSSTGSVELVEALSV